MINCWIWWRHAILNISKYPIGKMSSGFMVQERQGESEKIVTENEKSDGLVTAPSLVISNFTEDEYLLEVISPNILDDVPLRQLPTAELHEITNLRWLTYHFFYTGGLAPQKQIDHPRVGPSNQLGIQIETGASHNGPRFCELQHVEPCIPLDCLEWEVGKDAASWLLATMFNFESKDDKEGKGDYSTITLESYNHSCRL